MSEYDDLLPEEEQREGIQYVDAAGRPEEDDPAEEPLPSPPSAEQDDEVPPDPGFQILPRTGRAMPGIYLNGIAVGVWLHEEHYDLDGPQVVELLTGMGLDRAYAEWYGKMRVGRILADAQLANDPTVQSFAAAEEQHSIATAHMREAFLAAQRKKGG